MRRGTRRRAIAVAFVLLFLTALYAEPRVRLYSLEARRLPPGSSSVELILRATDGYHLNGPGYPALVLSLDPVPSAGEVGSEKSMRLESAGAEDGDAARWTISLERDVVRLSIRLRAVACGGAACWLIDESFEMEIP